LAGVLALSDISFNFPLALFLPWAALDLSLPSFGSGFRTPITYLGNLFIFQDNVFQLRRK
jgi:hypothetical protein